MKSTHTCPKCAGRRLFHVPQVHQPPEDKGWENQPWASAVTAIAVEPAKYGRYEIVPAGPCEAFVCATCGYTEYYASSHALQRLDEIARRSAHVQVIEGPPGPPYR